MDIRDLVIIYAATANYCDICSISAYPPLVTALFVDSGDASKYIENTKILIG